MTQAAHRIVDVSPGWAMARLDGCLLVVWRAQPTDDAFRKRNVHILDLAREYPGKCALLEVVEESSKPPSDETRRVAMEVFKTVGKDLSAIGFVLEGSQVRLSLHRAILTGMMFFVKQLQPTKIFKHTSDVSRWITPYLQTQDSQFETKLVSAIEELRKTIPSA